MRRTAILGAAGATALAALAGGCGAGSEGADATAEPARTVQRTTTVEVVREAAATEGFDARLVYRRVSPGVVTVSSVFDGGGLLEGERRDARGLGSGFVVGGAGEIATNAHVVTQGEGGEIEPAESVYVEFADGNRVEARIVGFDPHADVALLRVDPGGLRLRPVPLGSTEGVRVGAPVAAIGSPFGEERSLSVGVVSATERAIESLTGFQTLGALQTDAAINQGNSGGPLVDGRGHVLGINAQIRTRSGGGEGVGYAIPVDLVRRSLRALRRHGEARYGYLGVATTAVYPQLAERFDLGTRHGAWLQSVVDGGPADRAGLQGGSRTVRFQAREWEVGGDVIVAIDGRPIREENDLGNAVSRHAPGDRLRLSVVRDGRERTVEVTLAERPDEAASLTP